MAQRFLEVQVSRHIFTTVNIVVDDEDERFKGIFKEDGTLSTKAMSLLNNVAHQAADKIAPEYDWETDKTETEIDSVGEVSKEEATSYQVWDAQNNRKFES